MTLGYLSRRYHILQHPLHSPGSSLSWFVAPSCCSSHAGLCSDISLISCCFSWAFFSCSFYALKICISTIKFFIVSSTWLAFECSLSGCVVWGVSYTLSSRGYSFSFCESIVVPCYSTILFVHKTFQNNSL